MKTYKKTSKDFHCYMEIHYKYNKQHKLQNINKKYIYIACVVQGNETRKKKDRDEITWNCWSCQVVELFWLFITTLKKTKGCKKHIVNNETQKMKILKGTKKKTLTWHEELKFN